MPAAPIVQAHAEDKDWDAYCQQHDMETKIQYFIKMTGLVDAEDDQTDAFLKRFRPLMYRKKIVKTVGVFFIFSGPAFLV